METIKIEIDGQVLERIREIAIPFVDTSPNLVIRRLLGLPTEDIGEQPYSSSPHVMTGMKNDLVTRIAAEDVSSVTGAVEQLRRASANTHPGFLTLLMDKFHNAQGNYKTSDILSFLEDANLRTPSGAYRNPWMRATYKGEKNGRCSCTGTIEQFRQARKFGCWGGRNIKANCDAQDSCIYHPDNPDPIRNKCDLRKGVIWKRANPNSPFEYGSHYIDFIKLELLNKTAMPLEPLLSIFYPDTPFNKVLVDRFMEEFHFNEKEMELFSFNSHS
jgi:hypothetical protein